MAQNKPALLKQIQIMMYEIYGKRNAKMYGSANLLLRVLEETAVIAELFRKEDQSSLPQAIAHFFGWLIGFCNNEGIVLEDAVFDKYHGVCPNCGKVLHCSCISSEAKVKRWRSKINAAMPQTLPDWQEMFKNIYGRINKVAGKEKCWLHLLEELGEVSRVFRLKERDNLKDEIADVFAWLVAFCNNAGINLESAILDCYQGKCDACNKKKCECPRI